MLKRFFIVIAPWLMAMCTVTALLAFILFVKQPITKKESNVQINRVDVVMPIPPPPPPLKQQSQSNSSDAKINVVGAGSGPTTLML